MRGTVGPEGGPRWPAPLHTRTFFRVRLKYAKGSLSQQQIRAITYPKPPRRTRLVGRFVAEAYQGKRLLDVVPFNFPLLAPAESFTPTGAAIATRMEANLVTQAELEVPWLPTIDRVLVKDVATGRAWPLDLAPLRPRAARPTEPAAARRLPAPARPARPADAPQRPRSGQSPR